ncbi:MAG TPA: hypothetical protein VFQ12_00655 [Thermoleophilaceae bacterium]|nr:hypothetical protein [Thermoleophilaceae bacterium]
MNVLVVMAHRGEQVGDVVVVEGVVDMATLTASADQSERTQDPKVVGGCAHAQVR